MSQGRSHEPVPPSPTLWERKGGMSQGRSHEPVPPSPAARERGRGEGSALTFPPAPFLSHAVRAEGGDEAGAISRTSSPLACSAGAGLGVRAVTVGQQTRCPVSFKRL